MLTQYQKQAAHFAHTLDQDLDLPTKGEAKVRAYADFTGADLDETRAQYRAGLEVLNGWALSYSRRFVPGTVEPQPPEGAETLIVDAGHIAGAEAVRLAQFLYRGTPGHGPCTEGPPVSKLYHSRRMGWYIDDRGRRQYGLLRYQGAVVDLVREITRRAAQNELTVSRWETSSPRCGRVKTITWAVHEGKRPDASVLLDDNTLRVMVKLYTIEGTTRRCGAYKSLSEMLAVL